MLNNLRNKNNITTNNKTIGYLKIFVSLLFIF